MLRESERGMGGGREGGREKERSEGENERGEREESESVNPQVP
jgi:hypothetical protein